MEELLHTFYAKLVLDLSPADGKLAWACVKTRTAYMGICYIDTHVKLMEGRLLDLMKVSMKETASPLFNSAYAQAAEQADDDDNEKEEEAMEEDVWDPLDEG
ncbi:Uncharacterized protein SCF082_LOCUS38170 [Durusdinium trenchii]